MHTAKSPTGRGPTGLLIQPWGRAACQVVGSQVGPSGGQARTFPWRPGKRVSFLPVEMFIIVGAIYLAMTFPITQGVRWAEKKTAAG